MAIVCKEAAKIFIEASEGDFVVIGPVMRNTDVIVTANEPVRHTAMTENKHYQKELLDQRFGRTETSFLKVTGLPYALSGKEVDAAILDWSKAMQMNFHAEPASLADYDTFVLVANKDITETGPYRRFLSAYGEAVDALADRQTLRSQVLSWTGIDINEKGWDEWKIQLVKPGE